MPRLSARTKSVMQSVQDYTKYCISVVNRHQERHIHVSHMTTDYMQ